MLCAAAMISYLSRNAIGVAEEDVREHFSLTETQMGWVMSAFFITYAFMQIPCGRLCEIWGSRRALATFAVIWSFATMSFGLAMGLWTLLLARLVMGCAQAGLFPGSVISIGHWIPESRRAVANGSLAASMSVGGAVASILTGELLEAGVGWRTVFVIYLVPGVLWALWFYTRFRDKPADETSEERAKPADREGAVADRPSQAWASLFRSRTLWLICAQQACRASGYGFFLTWFPTFLKRTQEVDTATSGWLSSLPLFAVVIGSPTGGMLIDFIWRRTGSRRMSRQVPAAVFLSLSASLLVVAYFVSSSGIEIVLITLSTFSFALAGPCAYSITIDLGGRHVASVFSTMNMCGNLAAILMPIAVPVLVGWTGDWNHALLLVAAIYFFGAVCWMLLDPEKSILREEE